MIGRGRTNRIVISSWCQHLLLLKNPCDLFRAFSCKAKTVNSLYNCRSRLINQPFFLIVLIPFVAIGNSEVGPFSVGCLHCPHRSYLLAGLRRIPFIENVVEGHHFCTLAGFGVYTLLNGDELYTQSRIEDFQISTGFNMLTAKAG